MRISLIVISVLFASTALAQQAQPQVPKPQINVRTDAVLFQGGPSLGNSDRVRWDFYKADSTGARSDENVGGAYDATFEEKIPPGKYVAVAALGNISRDIPFDVKDGAVAELKANFEAAQLTIIPKRSADSKDAEPQARVEIKQGTGFSDSIYGSKEIFVPAGELKLEGRIGPARAEETISVKAGEIVSHDLVIPSGVVVANAVYKDGGRPVETDNIRFETISPTETLDGTRESIAGTYGVGKLMQMPAGDFIMRARLGKVTVETPFTVTAGQRTNVTVNLDAGVLAISAPDAQRIDILETTKDLQGTQKEVSGRYGISHQETLRPGNYSVKITYDKKTQREPKEVSATVTASERTELNITQ
jgi:Ca-activated chloride channel family protein